MEKNVEISMLCQIYGKMLTEKQYELLNDYYNNDLSLSEIAENENEIFIMVKDNIKPNDKKNCARFEESKKIANKIIK